MWYSGNYTELQMTKAQAESVSHSGDCELDVKELVKVPAIARQLKKLDPDNIRKEIKETGAWDDTELQDNEQNLIRFVWIAGCEITERAYTR